MNERRKKPLIPPPIDLWRRMGVAALLTATVAIGVQAQTAGGSGTQPPRNLNSDLRTRTWSVYAQGGVTWATGVWYPNRDAKRSYNQSPAVGGGVDFTIRPWVRVGAEYLWSRYRREQRFSAFDAGTMPIKTYGNYMMNYHNAKLGFQLNFMELWPNRRAQWFNVWAGTGFGITFARGNEHGVYLSNTKTVNGETTAYVDGQTIVNDGGTVSFTGNARTTNRHESFKRLYIPAQLHIEADVTRRFTVGLKGEVDWLLNRKDIVPRNYFAALGTVRYNFVRSRAQVQRAYYEGEISTLNDRVNALREEADAARARADREAAEKDRLNRLNEDLKRRLKDCEDSKVVVAAPQPTHFVQFANNSYRLNRAETDRLKEYAQSVRGKTLTLVAEASTPGTKDYNQKLSERRLNSVMDALVSQGFSKDNLRPTIAIGASKGKPDASGRRVTIKVEENK